MTAARITAGVVLMLVALALAVFASPASGLSLLAAFTALVVGDWWLD